jgi:hypothetical protein
MGVPGSRSAALLRGRQKEGGPHSRGIGEQRAAGSGQTLLGRVERAACHDLSGDRLVGVFGLLDRPLRRLCRQYQEICR